MNEIVHHNPISFLGDLETTVEAKTDLPKFEFFLSNYVAKSFDVWVYTKPNRFSKKAPPSLLRGDWNELVDGCYLMYPRDLAGAQMIYDGRWEYPPNPVQWAVSRYMAGPSFSTMRLKSASDSPMVVSPGLSPTPWAARSTGEPQPSFYSSPNPKTIPGLTN